MREIRNLFWRKTNSVQGETEIAYLKVEYLFVRGSSEYLFARDSSVPNGGSSESAGHRLQLYRRCKLLRLLQRLKEKSEDKNDDEMRYQG